jgi:hypothetical protein
MQRPMNLTPVSTCLFLVTTYLISFVVLAVADRMGFLLLIICDLESKPHASHVATAIGSVGPLLISPETPSSSIRGLRTIANLERNLRLPWKIFRDFTPRETSLLLHLNQEFVLRQGTTRISWRLLAAGPRGAPCLVQAFLALGIFR